MTKKLTGTVAVVAGATRGAGRGIAIELGAAGATVYITGRTTKEHRSEMARPETIEETAELVETAGGEAIALQVDHSRPDEVAGLANRLRANHGRLDVLVNDVWGGDPLVPPWGTAFWEHPLDQGLRLLRMGIETHVITSWHLAPLITTAGGLVVEVTDGTGADYRGNFFYDLVKAQVIRLAVAQAAEFAPHGGTAVALTPGFLRSEAMLEHFGVTEDTWRDGAATDPHFAMSETPAYVGRAVASLAGDPDVARYAGQALSSWGLAKAYGFVDADGSQPDWGLYFTDVVLGGKKRSPAHYREVAGQAG